MLRGEMRDYKDARTGLQTPKSSAFSGCAVFGTSHKLIVSAL